MSYEKTTENKVTQIENTNKQLGYSGEFKKRIEENPGLLKTFREIEDDFKNVSDKKGKTLEKNGVRVTYLEWFIRTFYLVEVGEERYFVKKGGKGFGEFESSVKALEILKDIPWVEVVNFQFGYSDNGSDYFVSKYDSRLNHTIQQTQYMDDLSDADKKDIEQKVRQLKSLLLGYVDFDVNNISYDRESKKLIIFDLYHRDDSKQ